MTYLEDIRKIETYDNTNVYAFVGYSDSISVGKDEEPFCEIFDLVDVVNITLHIEGFSLLTTSNRSFKYYYPKSSEKHIAEIIHKLAGLVDQRFNAGLQVYKQYPNIKITENQK